MIVAAAIMITITAAFVIRTHKHVFLWWNVQGVKAYFFKKEKSLTLKSCISVPIFGKAEMILDIQ